MFKNLKKNLQTRSKNSFGTANVDQDPKFVNIFNKNCANFLESIKMNLLIL